MEKKKSLQMGIIGVLAVAVLFMAIGFAAYSQTLNITGNVTAKASKWSIHWDTTSFTLGTGSQSLTSENGNPTFGTGGVPALSNTSMTFATTLNEPGEFVLFDVDAINDGTMDAELTGITISVSPAATYLTTEVTYGGNTYNATTSNLSVPLDAGNSETVTVKVLYNQPADSTQLPQNDTTVTVSIGFDYDQVTA